MISYKEALEEKVNYIAYANLKDKAVILIM